MKTKPKQYQRSIAKWTMEQAAKNDVCEKENLRPEQLKAVHTATHFVFEVVEKVKTVQNAVFQVAKDQSNEKLAIEAAMRHFGTFEGNLKPLHNDKNFVFRKIR